MWYEFWNPQKSGGVGGVIASAVAIVLLSLFALGVLAAFCPVCHADEVPAPQDVKTISAQLDITAALQCKREGFSYMMRLNTTRVLLLRTQLLRGQDRDRFEVVACEDVIAQAREKIQRIKDANH